MINLLPGHYKQNIIFARRNTSLRRWLAASIIGLMGIIFILCVGFIFIRHSTSSWQRQVADTNEQLKSQKLAETQNRVAEISGSVKLASDVLSKQVLFSKLLSQVGNAMPKGSSLQNLSINSIEGGIDLTAVATNYETASQVQVNLSDPSNKIFERADIISVNCSNNNDAYPCQVTIRALFAKNNDFQYSITGGQSR